MNVTFCCPRCEQSVRADFEPSDPAVACPACAVELPIPPRAIEGEELRRCVVCPSTELFIRKDFSQRLGVTIVLIGFAISTWAWFRYDLWLSFGILFATALADVALFFLMGDCLTCYRCHAVYRSTNTAGYEAFDLATHERHRQQTARMARSPGSSGQPSGG